MVTAADEMGQVGTIAVAMTAVGFVLSLARDGTRAPGRRTKLAGIVVASVLFLLHATLARSVAAGEFPVRTDLPLLTWTIAHRTPGLTALFAAISAVGGTGGTAVLGTASAVLFWLRHRRRAACGIVVAVVGSVLLMDGFKRLYGRSRPPLAAQLVPESSLSFPSGHALESIVAIGMVAVLIGTVIRSPVPRIVLGTVSAAAVVLIGASRLYLGVHWLSDVLAGWLLGGAWLALCVVITLSGRNRIGPEGKKSDNSSQEVGRSGRVPAAPGDHITGTTKETFP